MNLVAFAISGAGAPGINKRYQIFGVFVIVFINSTGDDMLRDLLLDNLPVSWIKNISYV
ncbi:MAG: TRIC cation channel family protein [Flavobacteriales bacterium]